MDRYNKRHWDRAGSYSNSNFITVMLYRQIALNGELSHQDTLDLDMNLALDGLLKSLAVTTTAQRAVTIMI
jgi:hypothetical protein